MRRKILNSICRSTVGSVNYLINCSGAAEVYSEAISKMVKAQGFNVKRVHLMDEINDAAGDSNRIDFQLSKKDENLFIVIKRAIGQVDLCADIEALLSISEVETGAGIIILFGITTREHKFYFSKETEEKYSVAAKGDIVTIDTGNAYSVQWFKFKNKSGAGV